MFQAKRVTVSCCMSNITLVSIKTGFASITTTSGMCGFISGCSDTRIEALPQDAGEGGFAENASAETREGNGCYGYSVMAAAWLIVRW